MESVVSNWRNQEEMEKSHFYDVLAYLLKQKKPLMTLEIMDSLLTLCGHRTEKPRFVLS